MRNNNALKKLDYSEMQTPVRTTTVLELFSIQPLAAPAAAQDSESVDFEAFMLHYGITSSFA